MGGLRAILLFLLKFKVFASSCLKKRLLNKPSSLALYTVSLLVTLMSLLQGLHLKNKELSKKSIALLHSKQYGVSDLQASHEYR